MEEEDGSNFGGDDSKVGGSKTDFKRMRCFGRKTGRPTMVHPKRKKLNHSDIYGYLGGFWVRGSVNNCRSFSLFSKFPENNNSNWKGCEDLWEENESGGNQGSQLCWKLLRFTRLGGLIQLLRSMVFISEGACSNRRTVQSTYIRKAHKENQEAKGTAFQRLQISKDLFVYKFSVPFALLQAIRMVKTFLPSGFWPFPLFLFMLWIGSIIVFSRGTKITLCPLERNFQGDARNEFRAYYEQRGGRDKRREHFMLMLFLHSGPC